MVSGTMPQSESPELSTALRALSHPHRRYVLYYLRERGSADVDELADIVAGLAADAQGGVVGATDRRGMHAMLHHAHLPKLAEAGYLGFDPPSGRVAVTEIPEPVADLLDVVVEHENRSERIDEWIRNDE